MNIYIYIYTYIYIYIYIYISVNIYQEYKTTFQKILANFWLTILSDIGYIYVYDWF